MPGASTGRNNSGDYVIGRGAAYFSKHDTVDFHPVRGYRDLGNVTEFKVQQEIQELEHYLTRSATKFADKQVILQQKMSIQLKLDEINFDNLALWMAGNYTTRSGYQGSATIGSPTDNIAPGQLLTQGGRWYDIFKATAGPVVTANRFDDRLYNLGVCTLTSTVNTSPVEGEDYIIDYKMGRIFIVPGMDLDNVPTQTVALAVAAQPSPGSLDEVQAFVGTPLRGSLKFIQTNPANSGYLTEYEFHLVQLKASGELDLIGDNWQEMTLGGVAEKNPYASAGSGVCTVRTYTGATGSIV